MLPSRDYLNTILSVGRKKNNTSWEEITSTLFFSKKKFTFYTFFDSLCCSYHVST